MDEENRMKLAPWVLLLLVGLAATASANDVAGSWHVVFVRGVEWKTIGDEGWPGTAPISDGAIDGDRISFLVHGNELQLTMTLSYSDNELVAGHIGKSDFKGQRITN